MLELEGFKARGFVGVAFAMAVLLGPNLARACSLGESPDGLGSIQNQWLAAGSTCARDADDQLVVGVARTTRDHSLVRGLWNILLAHDFLGLVIDVNVVDDSNVDHALNVAVDRCLAGARDARSRATEMLERVGLGQRLTRYPKVLSGGEQQRVALARAFVVEPAVLLADEPTGSLDFATGQSVMELMFALNRERGTTLILVTHDRAIAAQCERRITIEAGRVVENSTETEQ